MPKPLNINKNSGGNISSNSIVWNGPDLPCVDLCKGDTVTDVIYKLANKLCYLFDALNVESYDLTCLEIAGCVPETFQDLIQMLISMICELRETINVPGVDGLPGNYVETYYEAPGANCTNGGIRVELHNGVTTALISTEYICNGADGAPGTNGTQGPPGIAIVGPTGAPGTNGTNGVDGADGADGVDAIQPVITMTDSDTIDFVEVSGFPTYEFTANVKANGIRAQDTPEDMPTLAPAVITTNLYDGVKQIMAEIYDDDSAYDPTTGVWTCPATGIYDLSFYVHMSNGVSSGFTAGSVVAGIVSSTPTGYYCVNTFTVGSQSLRHVDITGQNLGMNLTAGLELQFNVLNLTDVNYTSFAGDVARMVIRRVK